MIKIKFCGAARTVTGSCHLITLDDGYKILLDCGLYQGREEKYDDFNFSWDYFNPEEIDCMILSHAHIDHCGRVPKLVKDGYAGNIYSTPATRDLAAIMLVDSAFIQEKDIDYVNRKRKRKGLSQVNALYTIEDAKRSLDHFVTSAYNRWFRITDKLEVLYRDAGHILGSSNVTLRIKQDDGHTRYIGFTGDIGRPERPILRDPVQMPQVDHMICESTYGGKEHTGEVASKEELLKIVEHTCIDKRGKLLIPAFSVGRTQELVYLLDQLETEGKLPKIPVFVDSPLAINATEVFVMHPECFDDDILRYMVDDPNPFGFSNLHYTRKVEASKRINDFKSPCIIISASGMMSAGRIKHHIANNIGNPKNTLLIVGYCSPGTLGGALRNGAEKVRIFGEHHPVKFEIKMLDSFSAHGDQDEMLEFLENQERKKLKDIYLVHGDVKRQEKFKEALLEKGFDRVHIPSIGQEFKL